MSFVWVESKNDDKNPVEKARDKDNHLVGSALKYSVQIPMRYMGSMVKRGVPSTGQTSRGYVNATTGY
jgi:hypothetical protein